MNFGCFFVIYGEEIVVSDVDFFEFGMFVEEFYFWFIVCIVSGDGSYVSLIKILGNIWYYFGLKVIWGYGVKKWWICIVIEFVVCSGIVDKWYIFNF